MLSDFVLAAFALVATQSADDPGLLIASDKDLSTSVRLVETDDSVRFDITGPDSVAPTISIDVNRNGAVDRSVDFQVGIKPGAAPCLSYLLDESSSTTCKAPGDKVKVIQSRGEQGMVTTIIFPKPEISGDGFGFGFEVRLWSMTGNYSSTLASGDYRFGGKLSLVSDGPNFRGVRKPDMPSPMLSALRRYQGCVNKAMTALEPLDRSMAAQVRALPATCAEMRSMALDQAVNDLAASGTPRGEASKMVRSSLDQYDEDIGRMADMLEKGR